MAATLGIADPMKDGPRRSDEFAAATGCHGRSLYRLPRALAAVGIFHEDGERRFALTAMRECLRTGVADSVADWAAFVGRPYVWQAWASPIHSVRTDENASYGAPAATCR